MATESPIRISEGTDRWRTLKQSNRYRPSSSEIAIEEGLCLFLNDQRCESAPPSMEGSLAAMENIFPNRKSTFNRGSTCPRISVINHKNKVRFHGNGSLGLPRNSLPAHEEEFEDDRLSEQSASVSVEKAGLSGYHSRSLDSTQLQEASQTSSPSYDQSCASTYKSIEEKVDSNACAHMIHNSCVTISSAGTNAPCLVDGDVEYSHIHVVKSVEVFNRSNPDSCKLHKNEQLTQPNNLLHHQAAPQESNTSRDQDSYAQIIYPGITHAYGSMNQFHYMTSPGPFYHNLPPAGFVTLQYSMGGYNLNSAVLPSYLPGYPHQGAVPLAFDGVSFHIPGVSNGYDMQNLPKFYGRVGVPLQPPFHMQYFQPPLRDSYGSYSHFEHQAPRDGAAGVNHVSFRDSRKGDELVGLSNDYNLNMKRGNMCSHHYFGSSTNVGHFRVSPAVQPKPAADNNFRGGRYNISKTNGQSQPWKDTNSHSFLEELKSGRGQRLELCDIAGYIVEFSVDQHGSRFIQQKLETCSAEEKASVFNEVVPHVSKLITDVFGNYVVQKFFEHGSPEQRMNLANQLEGQILPLSLQMYGCRVIQKALDAIDLEQKARLVRELDGHILRCVCDQNGNHVIQKCIESIPTDIIHFIISSFRGQVATLSMHPYGCRVIQRFLEHCNDNIQTQFIVDEILDSVCSLAQDQYGNYVTQHVLERGKPRERSQIIEKLAGSIVQLSQHKFASNVVEKCLEYSDSTSRGMLIKEIIGDGDENDNLLVMMKDQYANYVIQRILEKCSTHHREVLLRQIRNHLTALKKYTYGKHIVTRFEQLYGDGL